MDRGHPMTRYATTLLIAAFLAPQAFAGLVTFDLRDRANPEIEALDEAAAFSITRGGITANLSANLGVLNQTNSGFGINAPTGCDNSDGIDQGCGTPEAVSVGFDQAVEFVSFSVSGFSGDDEGRAVLNLDGALNSNVVAIQVDFDSFGTYNFEDLAPTFAPFLLTPGFTFDISSLSDNPNVLPDSLGFSFDSFTVRTVPEPGTLALLGAGLAGLGLMRRKTGRMK